VTISATLTFLRAHGLDGLVDGYGVHYYPDDKASPADRKQRMEVYAVSQRRAADVTGGKPCWMTEWKFSNNDKTCPINDRQRAALVQETMANFRDLAGQGRLEPSQSEQPLSLRRPDRGGPADSGFAGRPVTLGGRPYSRPFRPRQTKREQGENEGRRQGAARPTPDRRPDGREGR
jgi:hypothetical protein